MPNPRAAADDDVVPATNDCCSLPTSSKSNYKVVEEEVVPSEQGKKDNLTSTPLARHGKASNRSSASDHGTEDDAFIDDDYYDNLYGMWYGGARAHNGYSDM